MTKVLKFKKQSSISPASQMAFAVALCAFAAVCVGLIVNYWLTGWMAIGGMIGVGLFYTAVGILNLKSEQPLFDDETLLNSSQRSARAENLVGEAVLRPRLNPGSVADSQSEVGSTDNGHDRNNSAK